MGRLADYIRTERSSGSDGGRTVAPRSADDWRPSDAQPSLPWIAAGLKVVGAIVILLAVIAGAAASSNADEGSFVVFIVVTSVGAGIGLALFALGIAVVLLAQLLDLTWARGRSAP